jgi:polysaccharide deacetylase 2 family uncharacterized protein YibQ
MSRGEGCLGFVVPGPVLVAQSDLIARPLMKEIAERGLSLIEINPAGVSAMYRLTVDLGVGYARSSTVLDYKLAGQGSIDSNLDGWSNGPASARTTGRRVTISGCYSRPTQRSTPSLPGASGFSGRTA